MIIFTKATGKRTILGTDWPVETVVYRRENFGKPHWNVAFDLCNGTPSRSENFSTKKAALEAAGIKKII